MRTRLTGSLFVGLLLNMVGCSKPVPPPPATSTAAPTVAPVAPAGPPSAVPAPSTTPANGLQVAAPTAPAKRQPPLPDVGEADEFERAAALIRDMGRDTPALIVWLLDRSETALPVTQSIGKRIVRLEEELATESATNQRWTSVVTFGASVDFLLEEPTQDPQLLEKALNGIVVDESGKEVTFGAIQSAVERYSPYRLQKNFEVVLIIVTDEAGDDEKLVDEIVPRITKLAIPVYVLGTPAPFGRESVAAQFAEGPAELGQQITTVRVKQGPESRELELVTAQFLGNAETSTRAESGFGPFGLEWVTRVAGGEYWMLRAPPPDPRKFVDVQRLWPSAESLHFDPQTMRSYAPEYISAADYERLAQSNRARLAILNAAKMTGPATAAMPKTEFEYKSEVDLAKRLTEAQQLSARLQPQIDALYEELKAGEADRPKLPQPRWQAAYDLALGRTLAAKVRIDGYNTQLAALKRGKKFEKPESKYWILRPSDTVSGGSSLEKLADRARSLLQSVSQQHRGTPWAELADRELKSPLGWQWDER